MICSRKPDVSVVLNIHREATYIRRTLRSLNEAAAFAAAISIKTELIVVFDRSDEKAKQLARSIDLQGFVSVRYVEVDHGSLGLSRNSGIVAADGSYIWLSDADDLASYNCISAMYAIAEAAPNSVIFPEYLIAFGDTCLVAKYFDDSIVTSADFVYDHPYISRIFVRKNVFDDLRFQDLKLSNGFAYEDWHLNCELRALGLSFRIAPKTLLFYRQRKGSLLKQARAISVGQIPHSALFVPERFAMWVSGEAGAQPGGILDAKRDAARSAEPKKEILQDPECMELMAAVINIDPGINVHVIRDSGNYTNVWPNRHWGHDYAEACAIVGSGPFTDFVLLPNLGAGGGEKFVLDILHVLAAESPEFRCLVISGGAAENHPWIEKLPVDSIFLDLFNVFPYLGDDHRDLLTLRLVLAVSNTSARLHLQHSPFAIRWFSKFSACASRQFNPIYYRFCDVKEIINGHLIEVGEGFDFISTEIDRLSLLVTDHQRIVDSDNDRLGVYEDKWCCLYAVHPTKVMVNKTHPKFRLLWASRVCSQKRPDLLPRVVETARKAVPNLSVCVAGVPDTTRDWLALLRDVPGIEYTGPYNNLDSLEPQRFDALLYTSAYDGLPNVILEAMAWGLPVIAPDVGGISEAVQDGVTGWLLPSSVDDEQLVQAYAAAIARIYQDWQRTQELGQAARSLIERRHAPEVYQQRVRQIFLGVES